ncbi:MAG: hypothetical protein K8R53_12410 [Bacteroidales bacterium]|nr:hypothetical protein [Bacteroidales bacterium]
MDGHCYTFNFILIDGLDTIGIDAEKLIALRAHYANLALIMISRSIKDVKIRGSNEIVHGADIAIKVENGIAVTTKNLFNEKGRKFIVFEAFDR